MSGITFSSTYPYGEKWDPVLLAGLLSDILLVGITGTELTTGTITSDQLGAGCVITSKVLAEAITADKIAALTITANQLAANSVTTLKIAANSIIADHIQTDAITTTKLQAGSVIASKLSVTELSSISANLGTVSAGTLTAIKMGCPSFVPGVNRVEITEQGILGYDDTLGQTFKLPTDGSAPVFASGIIESCVIKETTIQSNDFRTSSVLPYIKIDNDGVSYWYAAGGAKYGTAVYGTDVYGSGAAGYFGNSSKPLLSVETELTLADIRLCNRPSAVPSGASVIGDLICIAGTLRICNSAGTGVGATYSTLYGSGGTDVAIADGGTGASTAQAALNALAGAVTANRVLRADGANIGLAQVALATDVSGQLALANGGTGTTSAQLAMNALAGGVTNNRVLRADGNNVGLAQVALATDVSGTLPIANGGTGITSDDKLVKGWVIFNGTTNTDGKCTILDSYNVTDVDDLGTGNYQINWATDFSSVNYAISGVAYRQATSCCTVGLYGAAPAAGTTQIMTWDLNAGSTYDMSYVSVMAIGNQ